MAVVAGLSTFLLFAGMALLIVVSLGAPRFDSLALMKLNLANDSNVNFGVFGYCLRRSGDTVACTGSSIGYKISEAVASFGITPFSGSRAKALDRLTGAFILAPIGAGVGFLAFLVAALSARFGFLFAATVAFLAWLITIPLLAINFAVFGIIRSHVNDNSNTISASFSVLSWLIVAAFGAFFIGGVATCCSCISGRRKSRETY